MPGAEMGARFWSKVEPTGFCWEWTAAVQPNGYGRFANAGRMVYAHRMAYELLVGPIPDGLVLDHLCRNRRCVNPDHLEAVTQGRNVARGRSPVASHFGKTHCKHGHEYTPENTRRDKHGARKCRACNRNNSRDLRRRRA